MIYGFGDSWMGGSELNFDEGEHPFIYHVAKELNMEYHNYGGGGNAYPIMVEEILYLAQDDDYFKVDDIILIVIPPNIRWYDENGNDRFEAWYPNDPSHKKRWESWAGSKTNIWFEYHACLFTFVIQSILDKIGCKYLFMYNYGDFVIDHRFKSLINTDNFLK